MSYRIKRLVNRIKKARYDSACRRVYAYPHRKGGETDGGTDYAIASLLSHQDMVMYLVALKSLTKYVGWPREVHIVSDGSLDDRDIAKLRTQIPNLVVTTVADIDTGQCPRGSCWERLCYILDLTASTYVVQMDADTVSLGDLTEVAACIAANRSFTLGTQTGQDTELVSVTKERALQMQDASHVQIKAELAMDDLKQENLRYVRGSAGFAGFAKGAFSRQQLETYSKGMEALIGKQTWTEWGTEQVASNFMIANAPDAEILKSPRHVNHFTDVDISRAVFVHFVGACRFDQGNYLRLSRNVLDELAADARLAR